METRITKQVATHLLVPPEHNLEQTSCPYAQSTGMLHRHS